jgi:hypothetical protein
LQPLFLLRACSRFTGSNTALPCTAGKLTRGAGESGSPLRRAALQKGLALLRQSVNISLLDSAETPEEQVGTGGAKMDHGYEIN